MSGEPELVFRYGICSEGEAGQDEERRREPRGLAQVVYAESPAHQSASIVVNA